MITLRHISVGSMDNNAYLLTDQATGQQCLVDAAAEPDRLQRLIDEGTGRLDLLVTTHQHWDHVGALRDIVASHPGVRTAAGARDADALPVAPDIRLQHGDTLRLGDSVIDVVELRGHTPGGVALVITNDDGSRDIITGDSLFPGGVGNTRNEGQDFDQLFADVTTRLFDTYDHARVWPGHGDSTTLDAERPHLDEWRARGW